MTTNDPSTPKNADSQARTSDLVSALKAILNGEATDTRPQTLIGVPPALLGAAVEELTHLRRENAALREATRTLHRYSRRYCDGRSTYAPDDHNRATHTLLKLGVKLDKDPISKSGPFAQDGMYGLTEREREALAGPQQPLTAPASAAEVLLLLARAIETQRDRQKCGIFIEDLADRLDPAHLRSLAAQPAPAPRMVQVPADLLLRLSGHAQSLGQRGTAAQDAELALAALTTPAPQPAPQPAAAPAAAEAEELVTLCRRWEMAAEQFAPKQDTPPRTWREHVAVTYRLCAATLERQVARLTPPAAQARAGQPAPTLTIKTDTPDGDVSAVAPDLLAALREYAATLTLNGPEARWAAERLGLPADEVETVTVRMRQAQAGGEVSE